MNNFLHGDLKSTKIDFFDFQYYKTKKNLIALKK